MTTQPGGEEFDPGDKLRRIEKALENPGAILTQIGAIMVAESQQAFRAQEFDGERWPPRGEINVFGIIADFAAGKAKPPNRRFETRPALRDTGRLAASISFKVSASSVEVGTNLDYAEAHQTGGQVKSETITQKVQERLRKWLKTRKDPDLSSRLSFLLAPGMLGKALGGRVPERKFLGVTKQTEEDIAEIIRTEMFDA